MAESGDFRAASGAQAEPSTDDDCDSDSKHSQSYRERRREAHTAAEQKRRDAIKKGYDTLQELVPTCTQTDASGHKVSKAVVLQKSIDFIQHLSKQKKSQENDLTSLRKEVVALQIMRANYEQLVRAHMRAPQIPENLVADRQSFRCSKCSWTRCVFSWIEERCKPGDLQDLMSLILRTSGKEGEPAVQEPIDPAYQRM